MKNFTRSILRCSGMRRMNPFSSSSVSSSITDGACPFVGGGAASGRSCPFAGCFLRSSFARTGKVVFAAPCFFGRAGLTDAPLQISHPSDRQPISFPDPHGHSRIPRGMADFLAFFSGFWLVGCSAAAFSIRASRSAVCESACAAVFPRRRRGGVGRRVFAGLLGQSSPSSHQTQSAICLPGCARSSTRRSVKQPHFPLQGKPLCALCTMLSDIGEGRGRG